MRRRAVLSVSDTTGIVDAAGRLAALGFEIVATDGTRALLAEAGIAAVAVEQVTGAPAMFGGRVKTLHPLLLGGVLFDRSAHAAEAAERGIPPIELVIVTLYDVQSAIDAGGDIVEKIDVGGVTLLRAAAKNHAAVTVLCDPADYAGALTHLEATGDVPREEKRRLAAKAFAHTARYDGLIAESLSGGERRVVVLGDGLQLRYGENPHQRGWSFTRVGGRDDSPPWRLLQGTVLSYLNLLDADAAWGCVREFSEPAAVFVKHATPSGAAIGTDIEAAFQAAYDADRVSAFGVIIALNRPCTAGIARKILEQKMFVELIIAPDIEEAAAALLTAKPKLRLVAMGEMPRGILLRSALGGVILTDEDSRTLTAGDLTAAAGDPPDAKTTRDLLFAWHVVKHCRSNAIVVAKDGATLGIGAGQTSRVEAVRLALERAGDRARGAVMASDAFFPFADSVEAAADAGIAAIVQPGGSVRDAEVIAAAQKRGITMVTTGVRAFRH